jgi:membrane-associated protein
MDLIKHFIDMVLHLDKYLVALANDFGVWTYFILFVIIFCETGLVVTPFLPGDSLLFAIGALSAIGGLNIWVITILLIIAAILGDTINYHIGKYIGPKVFHKENVRFLNKKHLIKTHEFYERHGGKTIIIARFVPIIRTFAPFVAGMGSMSYARFIVYNVVGGVLWVVLLVFAGYFFGNIPIVKKNFTLVIFAIIFISILPGVIAYLNEKISARKNAAKLKAASVQEDTEANN